MASQGLTIQLLWLYHNYITNEFKHFSQKNKKGIRVDGGCGGNDRVGGVGNGGINGGVGGGLPVCDHQWCPLYCVQNEIPWDTL
jgi:hypothetical protein